MEQRFDAGYIAAAKELPSGAVRIYTRIAKADSPLTYFNQDGTKRIEVIKADDLFSPASVASARGIPAFIGHPAMKLDSSTIRGHIHGALGENLVREDTDNGSFLGATATIYTDEAKSQAAKHPGVSPGYGVQIDRVDSDTYRQHSRVYDHLAIAVMPREKDAQALFQGIRMDSQSSDSIWIARYDEACYQCNADNEFIDRVLDFRSDRADLIERTPIRLTEKDLTPPTRHNEDKACGCDECAAKKKAEKNRATRGQGFGDAPKPPNKKKMSTTTYKLDGVDWEEIPSAFAQAVQVRLDQLSETAQKLEATQERLAEAESRADQLETQNAALVELLEEESEERTDSEPEFDEAAFEEAVIATAATIDRMRTDGRALVDAGRISEFNEDAKFICDNMGDLQREMIGFANPAFGGDRLDGFEPEKLAVIYDASMEAVRAEVASRKDSVQAVAPAQSSIYRLGSSLRADGMKDKDGEMSMPWMKKKGRKKEYDEELKAQDEAFNSVGAK